MFFSWFLLGFSIIFSFFLYLHCCAVVSALFAFFLSCSKSWLLHKADEIARFPLKGLYHEQDTSRWKLHVRHEQLCLTMLLAFCSPKSETPRRGTWLRIGWLFPCRNTCLSELGHPFDAEMLGRVTLVFWQILGDLLEGIPEFCWPPAQFVEKKTISCDITRREAKMKSRPETVE